MALDPEQDGSILKEKNETADDQDQAKLSKGDEVVVGGAIALGAWIEFRSDHGKTDHDTEVNELADPLKEGVDAKADIVKDDLKPGEPENGEEAGV